MITPQDIIFEFRKYCKAHPLRIIADLFYDEKGHFKIEELAKNAWAINTMNAIQRALTTLCSVSEDAYRDMIHNKLPAKAGKDYDDHQLISAFCDFLLKLFVLGVCRKVQADKNLQRALGGNLNFIRKWHLT